MHNPKYNIINHNTTKQGLALVTFFQWNSCYLSERATEHDIRNLCCVWEHTRKARSPSFISSMPFKISTFSTCPSLLKKLNSAPSCCCNFSSLSPDLGFPYLKTYLMKFQSFILVFPSLNLSGLSHKSVVSGKTLIQ